MALPPIISNSPIMRLFTGPNTAAQRPAEDKGATAGPARDSVSISDEALQKLAESKTITEPQARQTSAEISETLASRPDLTLTDNQDALV